MSPPDFTILPTLGVPDADLMLDPKRLFLFLTQWTCPYGGEEQYYGKLLQSLGFHEDGMGNWYLAISTPDGSYPTTCFAAHLDTADSTPAPVSRFRTEEDIVFTDGKSILGADDRAGVTVLLSLAQRDVPGLYYLFSGEERGCIGSGRVAKMNEMPAEIKRVICFDRKGYDDVITHQGGRRTCSDEFAEALAEALNRYGLHYEPSPNGIYTDSREFADDVPECTNLSIGYQGAHTHKEAQDLGFLCEVIIAALNIDWEALPVVRDPSVKEKSDWGSYRGYQYGWDDDDDGWLRTDWKRSEDDWRSQDWVSAISDLVADFKMGCPPDEELIKYLVQEDKEDTITAIYLLLDELATATRRDIQ